MVYIDWMWAIKPSSVGSNIGSTAELHTVYGLTEIIVHRSMKQPMTDRVYRLDKIDRQTERQRDRHFILRLPLNATH